MRLFVDKKVPSSPLQEDFVSTVTVYEPMTNIFQVNNEDKLEAIKVILSGNVLIYFPPDSQNCSTRDETVPALERRYIKCNERARIFAKWYSLSLAAELGKTPDVAEVEVFRKFVARLRSLRSRRSQLPR